VRYSCDYIEMTTLSTTTGNAHVGVRELKAQLSRYLGRVKDGQTIVITERGREVARIVPAVEREIPDVVRQLLRSGAAAWSGKDVPDFDPVEPSPLQPGGLTLAEMVSEDRR
jgi:prevent-host-death family protein